MFRFSVTQAAWLLLFLAPATAATIVIPASKDSAIYSEDGMAANGSGDFLFAGETLMLDLRRSLIAFDVAGAVPAGANITAVSLRLFMDRTIAASEPATLHLVTQDWGEGASDAPGPEGIGDLAVAGDSTWTHAFIPGTTWMATGGDFDPTASATTMVDGIGAYDWLTTPMLVADVQGWLDTPAANFGWMLRGNETAATTAKRFVSRTNPTVANRPQLTVSFDLAASCAITAPATGAGVSGDATITWNGNDVGGLPLTSALEFSTDAGMSWQPATGAGSSPTMNPDLFRPTPFTGVDFIWDTAADGVGVPMAQAATMRIGVNDGAVTGTCQVDVIVGSGCASICGDCNLDASMPNILDSLLAAQISVAIVVPSPAQVACCDVNLSGVVTILDALAIAQDSLSLPVTLTCI